VPQDLRARHIGHVVVNSSIDRPWSEYFCCMLASHREFVQRCPVATKRVLRAILKAANLCAREPAVVAQRLVDGSYAPRYDYALQTLRDVPYDKWREYDAEDTPSFSVRARPRHNRRRGARPPEICRPALSAPEDTRRLARSPSAIPADWTASR
jgi:NitT/TauT family transport system substrate-binding protein